MERSQEEWDARLDQLLVRHYGEKWSAYKRSRGEHFDLEEVVEFLDGHEREISPTAYAEIFEAHVHSTGVDRGMSYVSLFPLEAAYEPCQRVLVQRADTVCQSIDDLATFLGRVDPWDVPTRLAIFQVAKRLNVDPGSLVIHESELSARHMQFVVAWVESMTGSWEDWHALATYCVFAHTKSGLADARVSSNLLYRIAVRKMEEITKRDAKQMLGGF